MRGTALTVLIITALVTGSVSVPTVARADTITAGSAVVSANKRNGGGKFLSKHAVWVHDVQYDTDLGFYLRDAGTANGRDAKDYETDLGGGYKKPCWGKIVCQAESMYWILPGVDLVDTSATVSRQYTLDNGDTASWTGIFESLNYVDKGTDTQIYRAIGSYGTTVFGQPFKFTTAFIYNAAPDNYHAVFCLSAPINLGTWEKATWTATPAIEWLQPFNHVSGLRESGAVFSLRLGTKFDVGSLFN